MSILDLFDKKILNFTEEEIKITNEKTKKIKTIKPEKNKLKINYEKKDNKKNIYHKNIENLPDEKNNTYIVVPTFIFYILKRSDLLMVKNIRDEKGKIIEKKLIGNDI